MSTSINVRAFASKESPEFKKHYKAVEFCVANQLSYPKETSEFFKGKLDGLDLEDIYQHEVLRLLKNGIHVHLETTPDEWGNEVKIKVSDIPKEADIIVINLT